MTNLKVSAVVIYSLYRIRWQIELNFNGCKRITKCGLKNDNIIEVLALSSIIASFALHVVFKERVKGLTEQEKLSISFQRLSHVVVLLAQAFIRFLTLANHMTKLKNKINLLSCEIFEKNHKHRPTTLQILARELGFY